MDNVYKNTVVALGMFDGVHIGHAALLRRAAQIAKASNAKAIAFTFAEHPQNLFGYPVQRLTNMAERKELIAGMGMQTDAIPFTRELANLSPQAFTTFLAQRFLGLQCIVVGYNYTFGANAQGTAQILKSLFAAQNIHVEILPAVQYGGEAVSSSRIRAALSYGDMPSVTAMLGRYYHLSGIVGMGQQIGRSLGFPTANLQTESDRALPRDGVYASLAVWGGEVYPAVTNIGKNPTVGGQTRTVETHVLEEIPDLYGRELTIFFCEYLRQEQKFASKAALSAQIEQDGNNALRILAAHGLAE